MAWSDWSTNPANNGIVSGVTYWPEGMLPSQVDDTGRQMMADLATWLAAPTLAATLTTSGIIRQNVSSGGQPAAVFQNNSGSTTESGIASIIGGAGNNTSSYTYSGVTSGIGTYFIYGNGTTGFTSDQRMKKDIAPARDGYLADIKRLEVVKYRWKNQDETSPLEMGLIAQQVQTVFPGMVGEAPEVESAPVNDDGSPMLSLKAGVLPFLTLKGLQELLARVEAIEAAFATAGTQAA